MRRLPISTPNGRSALTTIDRIVDSKRERASDRVAVEEPLEIRLNGKSVAVVMRSPGNDEELAAGFLLTEAILKGKHELRSIRRGRGRKNSAANVVEVVSTEAVKADKRGWQRNFVSASSCGLCGKLTIEAVRLDAPPIREDGLRVSAETLASLAGKMRSEQEGFDETGGVHAAGLFDAEGELLYLREDIGRHNAVDKIVGAALLEDRLPLAGRILVVSGRASFEIVQKALMARIPLVAAVSAASSLAVDLAESSGMALVGFLRGSSMNVYCGTERIEVR